MKKIIIILSIVLSAYASNATIHIIKVWDGYFQFVSPSITIQLGDTVQWLPLDVPAAVHTITSSNIPVGAASFDQIWQAPADTFFQYIPQVAGLYEYVCTPHVTFGMVGSITVLNGTAAIHENIPTINDLLIYPNPTTGSIYINESNTLYDYNIYNSAGKMLLSGKLENEIDISGLLNGIYILELISDEVQIVKIRKE